MKYASLAVLAATLTLPAAAESETFTIDPNHTFPSWEISHMGISTQRGRFDKTAGKITVDTAAKTGSVEVTIDAASVDTGHPKLGEHLRSPDFLNVSAFPTLTFKSNEFAFDGEKVKSVKGELTVLGITQPVVLNAERFACGSHPLTKKKMCGAEFTAVIKRSDWGLKRGIPSVGDEMLLRINVEAVKD